MSIALRTPCWVTEYSTKDPMLGESGSCIQTMLRTDFIVVSLEPSCTHPHHGLSVCSCVSITVCSCVSDQELLRSIMEQVMINCNGQDTEVCAWVGPMVV